MHEVVALDASAGTVTVDAGITYGQLCPYLDSKGFALHNLASLPHISIAGACSTATHGSGEKNGNLATAVSALEFVTASGEVVKLSRKLDGEVFRGAVVGLGALGVITRVTLDIQPTYAVRQYVYEDLPLDQMKEHFDDIQSSAYSVSLFTDWQKRRINELWIKSRVGDEQAFAAAPGVHQLPMPAQKLLPGRLPTSLWRRFDAVSLQNLSDRAPSNLAPEIGQGALNPSIAPIPVFFCEFYHQGFEIHGRFRTPRSALRTSVIFNGDQLPMPGQ
jgi:FAD/FMN-containing dehydrogenase